MAGAKCEMVDNCRHWNQRPERKPLVPIFVLLLLFLLLSALLF